MRRFVQEIEPKRVSSIDRQIEDVGKLMKVGEVFKEALDYIQGRQDATKAQVQITQLNKVRSLTTLSAGQVDELDALLSALKNQETLYRDFREFLSQLHSKKCLPTKEKIEEQLKLIGQLEDMDGYMISSEYHKSYVAAIEKLKDNLQKAAANDRRIAPVVKDDAKFPGMIDEILNML
jgi:ribosomal protein L16 Arg81 hydroxylase